MIVPLSSYNPDSQPLGRFRGFPVYLSTVLVVSHVAALFLSAIVGMGLWGTSLAFAAPPSALGGWAQVWRWVTYLVVNVPDIWFIVDMVLLYVFGMRLEQTFGRRVFASLYVWLVIIPPVLTVVLSSTGLVTLLAGPRLNHFCLFLAYCFMEPKAPFFVPHPAFQAKYVGTVLFAINVLDYLGSRQFGLLIAFLANCAFTYAFLRRQGLPNRFESLTDAFRQALPRLRPAKSKPKSLRPASAGAASSSKGHTRPSQAGGAPENLYKPKIKPREDLPPEKKAVRDVDALLDKIGRHGMESLTPEEREALRQASARLKKEE